VIEFSQLRDINAWAAFMKFLISSLNYLLRYCKILVCCGRMAS